MLDYIEPNSVGSIIRQLSTSNLDGAACSACRTQVERAGTELVLALSKFERTDGELPNTLEALVRHYLNRVPLDPF